jgi:RHS repeat-associated protein
MNLSFVSRKLSGSHRSLHLSHYYWHLARAGLRGDPFNKPDRVGLEGINQELKMKRTITILVISTSCLFAPGSLFLRAQTVSLTAQGFTNSQFAVRAVGGSALALQWQVSSNLINWDVLASVTPFQGTNSLVDTNSPGKSARYYRAALSEPAASIQYVGNNLLLMGYVPAGYGPGALVYFFGTGTNGPFSSQITADANGLYTYVLNASMLSNLTTLTMFVTSSNGAVSSPHFSVLVTRAPGTNTAAAVPTNLAMDVSGSVEPDICTCGGCPVESLMSFDNSFTPTDSGTELVTGKMRYRLPILSFATRKLGFSFQLTEASLVGYGGPSGSSFSHSYNMMVVQTGANSGQIITPGLRVFNISSTDGTNWTLPAGFESTLTLNPDMHRWTLTHYGGLRAQFYQGAMNGPGYPVAVSDPNGNTTTLFYDGSGYLQSITTDLGQTETFGYTSGLLSSFTDHLARTWTFSHDASNRISQVITPATQYAAIPAGGEVIDSTLAGALVTRGRTRTIGYANAQYPSHITSITDDRGAVPRSWLYDAQGRVTTNFINGNPKVVVYGPSANPAPLPKLETLNIITRAIDSEGNITDYEIHSRAGGPVGGAGQFGIRRKVTWTQSGQGNPPLRPGEPAYYEQRWLQDCDCLSPAVVVQPFSSQDSPTLSFDSNKIPGNWPRTILTYNNNRQATAELYTDGTNSIQVTSTYQVSSFGQSNQFSRLLTRTDPRAYDGNPIYAGLSFVHSYQYDADGNPTNHSAPTVTRGVITPQAIVESWTYNVYGQQLSYTDPNGDITTYAYYTGTSTGGNINTPGMYGGYLASVTWGAGGSADPVTSLTTSYKVNALGMVTEMTDPRGLVTDYQYNNLGEKVLTTEPTVTLWTGQQFRYTSSTFYDGAGNAVLIGRTNLDYNGAVLPVPSVAVSRTYDAINHLLSERRVVDANHAHDLITRFAYNSNDLEIVTQKPRGNREFTVYDDRLLPFRTFYGVAPGPQITNGYPASKQATNLGATSFVGYRQQNYDSRKNLIQARDRRGYLSYSFYDFNNRPIAQSDPNGNGRATVLDAAGNALTIEAGVVSPANGAITQVLSRTYLRFDEDNRPYQSVTDANLSTDERGLVNPATAGNPNYLTRFDPGSRVVQSLDANSNPTTFSYDAAGRRVWGVDALGNSATNTYDPDGNVVALTEVEVAGPGAFGAAQTYLTTFVYDGNNQQTEVHVRGLNGNSLDDHTFFAFDSRGNPRLVEDAGTNFVRATFDYANRTTLLQRFDGDPTSGSPNVLSRLERVYDVNGNVAEDHSFSSATNLTSIQITRHAYDNDDRKVRTVYPDSDNPIDGSNNGPSGIYNRIEISYDAEADPVTVQDQRQVVFSSTFDPGRRLTSQNITLTNGVPGITQQQFGYDARNLMTSAMNNYASVNRSFDALGRMTNETQAIRLDGSGFVNGWEQPVSVLYRYDLESNQTNCLVVAGTNTDLSISQTVDALNRSRNITAQYFNISNSPVATYNYFGPGRIQTKLLGNGARMTNTFDAKRRLSSLVWNGSTNNLLVGFQYAHDSMDNPRSERWLHDNGGYDHYQYNHRYELTGVAYRSSNSAPPVSFPATFAYNDNLDRQQATFGGPFSTQPTNVDIYIVNPADQYTNLTRNAIAMNPAYDRAGNMTSVPVLPVTGVNGQTDLNAATTWDAVNCLFSVHTGQTPDQNYRYDPFRRRIATLSGLSTTPERRFIYGGGWTTLEERLFDLGATPASAPSTLERIYVDGPQIDEHLLTAIDRNGNGVLDAATLNNTDISADQWYYLLPNQIGSVTALLAANNPNQTLEYYRYTAYGEATVLPPVGSNTNLAVNFAQGWQRSSPEHGNTCFFTGQWFDDRTGMYQYRNRYYEPRAGVFLSRDPFFSGSPIANLSAYVANNPASATDPMGLWEWKAHVALAQRFDWTLDTTHMGDLTKDMLKNVKAKLKGPEEIYSVDFVVKGTCDPPPLCDLHYNLLDKPKVEYHGSPPDLLKEVSKYIKDVQASFKEHYTEPEVTFKATPDGSRCVTIEIGVWSQLKGSAEITVEFGEAKIPVFGEEITKEFSAKGLFKICCCCVEAEGVPICDWEANIREWHQTRLPKWLAWQNTYLKKDCDSPATDSPMPDTFERAGAPEKQFKKDKK